MRVRAGGYYYKQGKRCLLSWEMRRGDKCPFRASVSVVSEVVGGSAIEQSELSWSY